MADERDSVVKRPVPERQTVPAPTPPQQPVPEPEPAVEAQPEAAEDSVLERKRANVNIDVPDLPTDTKVRLNEDNKDVNVVSVAGVDYDFSAEPTQEVTAPVAELLVQTGVVEVAE